MPAGSVSRLGHAPGGETFEHRFESGHPLALEGLLAAELVETPAHIVGECVESAGELTPQFEDGAAKPGEERRHQRHREPAREGVRRGIEVAPDHPPAHSPSRAAANPARIRPRPVAATSEAPTSFC